MLGPTIFISSPFSLKQERTYIRLLIDKLGWRAICLDYEDTSRYPGLLASIDEAQSADFLIALFDSNYGSIIDTDVISFTHREIWEALAAAKPRRLYVSRCQPNREQILNLTLPIIQDADIGCPTRYFDNSNHLLRLVKADLLRWQCNGFKEDPILYVERILGSKGLINACSPNDHVNMGLDFRAIDPSDPHSVQAMLDDLTHLAVLKQVDTCYRAGIAIWRLISPLAPHLPISDNHIEWVRIWIHLLEILKWIQNVRGESHGLVGSISLAKAVVQLHEVLGDGPGYVAAVNGLAGCYYSAGQYKQALNTYDLVILQARIPSLMSTRQVAEVDRCRVLARLERYQEALRSCNRVATVTGSLMNDEKEFALTIGLLGSLEVASANSKNDKLRGLRRIEEARELLGFGLSRVRVDRLYAEALVRLKETEEACQVVRSIINNCQANNFRHQIWRLQESKLISCLLEDQALL